MQGHRPCRSAVTSALGSALRPALRGDVRQTVLEKHAEVEPHAELLLHLSQSLEAQQRVPAHLKEPVVAANRSSGMNQLCPDLGDRGLDWVGWSLMLADTAL